MTKEEILKEIEEIKDAIFVSNRRIDVLETEVKKLEEPKPWEPKINEFYYYIDTRRAGTTCDHWDGGAFDYRLYNSGNCFPTEERVKQVAEKIKMLLKLERYHDMFCPDYVPDWENHTQRYYVFYNFDNERWEYNFSVSWKTVTQVYFDSEETAQKVCDLLNREDDENEQK